MQLKTKFCSGCKIERSVDIFCKRKTANDGLDSRCNICKKQYRFSNLNKIRASEQSSKRKNRKKVLEYQKKYYIANRREKLIGGKIRYEKNRKAILEKRRCKYKEDILINLLRAARKRAKRKEIKYNLNIDDIRWTEKCPITGIRYNFGNNGSISKYSRTIDRINPGLGYVSGNVVVVSAIANTTKNDATVEELGILTTNLQLFVDKNITWAEKCELYNIKSHPDEKKYRKVLLYNARKRAKKYKREMSISEKEIKVPDLCPLLKIPLLRGRRPIYNSPSLDRINNTMGYSANNIQVISQRANLMKGSSTLEEIETIYRGYKQLSARLLYLQA